MWVEGTQSNQGEVPSAEARQGSQLRAVLREAILRNAMRKRAEGVPTYSVPEAAALLSISQEYLYRLIQAGGFPAVRMRIGGRKGRYVVPAKAVEKLLDAASDDNTCIDAREWTERWQADISGGAA
jgi:excisionase family DNA binding protein